MQKYNFIKSTFNFSNAPIKRFVKIEKKEDLLKKLKDEISNIENCSLKNNSNNLVFADGDHNSSIMLIGEGPGQKEDEQGKPFVGDAGLLLNKMLAAINIKRNKVYLTMVTFHPAYLLRQPDQKKFSWTDLKEIKNKIEELKIGV